MIETTTKISTNVKAGLGDFLFGIRQPKFMIRTMMTAAPTSQQKRASAFTLVELMGVMVVIAILAGLTLGGAGAVRRQGAVNQAKAEIAALQAACERYFADNNAYPTNTAVNPASSFNPSSYSGAGTALFSALFGTNQYNLPSSRKFFEPKPSMVSSTNTANPWFIDPWGYAYGYNSDGTSAPLIWSTAGQTTGGANTNKWITSWPKM